jgi:hypothetical protein
VAALRAEVKANRDDTDLELDLLREQDKLSNIKCTWCHTAAGCCLNLISHECVLSSRCCCDLDAQLSSRWSRS